MKYFRLIIPLFFIVLYLLGDYATYQATVDYLSGNFQAIFSKVYVGLTIFSVIGFLYPVFQIATRQGRRTKLSNFFVGSAFSIILTKLLYLPFVFANKIWHHVLLWIPATESWSHPLLLTPFLYIGLAFACLLLLAMFHGITFGKYRFQVSKKTLYFKDLPEAFDGFTLTQISDIHAGSLDDIECVQKGVDMANAQGSDLIVFTGDLVNVDAKEIDPFVPVFSQLKADYGVYSILGNHDYYQFRWKSTNKEDNYEILKEQHAQLNFQLLLNQNIEIEKDGESISLLGVENWGKAPFPQIGDLASALTGTEEMPFRILLSHDPSHWDAQVLHQELPIHLTLSGHTHGMQFGIDFMGIKWSPSKFRYPRWAGLYKEKNAYLYVNRGFGFHGLPGRVGMWPEITVLELKRS